MRNSVSTAEHGEILAALKGGSSQNSVAKRFRRSPSTVNRISQSEGLVYASPKNISRARNDYNLTRQLELSNKWLAKLNDELDEEHKMKDLRDLSVSLGIAFDKRMLLDGRATVRTEILGSGKISAVDRLKALLGQNDDNQDSN